MRVLKFGGEEVGGFWRFGWNCLRVVQWKCRGGYFVGAGDFGDFLTLDSLAGCQIVCVCFLLLATICDIFTVILCRIPQIGVLACC